MENVEKMSNGTSQGFFRASRMQETQKLGTDFWNDSCDLNELQHAVATGAVGATSNPVIVATAVEKNQEEWFPVIDRLILSHPDASEDEIAWKLVEEVGKKAAALLEGVFVKTQGQKGKLSLQVSPRHYRSAQRMVAHGEWLANLAPNIAIKVPAIESGIQAMEELTSQGISVNATVSFSVAQAVASAEAIERGLERNPLGRVSAGSGSRRESPVTPYVTLMVGRIDDFISHLMTDRGVLIDPRMIPWAGIAVFKKAYQIFRRRGYQARLLAAAYRHSLHWTELVGGNTVLSMPYQWWSRFEKSNLEVSSRIDHPIDERIIHDLSQGFPEFVQAYEEQGMECRDFIRYGASQRTLNQFLGGLDQLCAIVRRRMFLV